MSLWQDAQRLRRRWTDCVPRTAWERQNPLGKAGGVVWGEGRLGLSALIVALRSALDVHL